MFLKKILYRLFKYEINHILKYRNLHSGEDCVLFGDGVSIKWFDLKSFTNILSITVGYLPFHNDFNKLNCKY
jgi:hypothetical protein